MNNAGRPLDKLTFDELKRILKFPVLDETGSRIGIVDKIYVDQKKMKAKAVEILMDNGKHKKVSASKLVYIDGVVVFSKNGRISLKKAMVLGTDVDPLIRKARELLDEVRIVKKRIHMLDDLLVQGKITETTFKILRRDYESRLKALQDSSSMLVETLRKKLVELEKKEESLATEINLQEARMYLGEITKEEFEEKTKDLRIELEKLRAFKNTVREFLSEYSDEINIVLPPKEELREEPKVKLDEHTVIKPVEEESGEEVVIDQVNINEKEYEDKKLNVEVKDLDKIL